MLYSRESCSFFICIVPSFGFGSLGATTEAGADGEIIPTYKLSLIHSRANLTTWARTPSKSGFNLSEWRKDFNAETGFFNSSLAHACGCEKVVGIDFNRFVAIVDGIGIQTVGNHAGLIRLDRAAHELASPTFCHLAPTGIAGAEEQNVQQRIYISPGYSASLIPGSILR